MAPAITAKYTWILAITSISFVFSAFGNGANDVANSYATSVAARTLTMPQVGFLSMITEFIGAVGLGARVTNTIKNGIINIDRFEGAPAALMLSMGCVEVGSASWLMLATRLGLPVSTTQTVVGSLIGAGFASQASVKWAWSSGSVSQVAASWAIAPLIAAGFSAFIFGVVKYSVLERKDSFKWAMRLIPFYFATTAAILALFIVVEAPTAPSLEDFGIGKAVGIILGVWFGMLGICYVFFVPYFERRLIKEDPRVKFYHVPLGPLLRRRTHLSTGLRRIASSSSTIMRIHMPTMSHRHRSTLSRSKYPPLVLIYQLLQTWAPWKKEKPPRLLRMASLRQKDHSTPTNDFLTRLDISPGQTLRDGWDTSNSVYFKVSRVIASLTIPPNFEIFTLELQNTILESNICGHTVKSQVPC